MKPKRKKKAENPSHGCSESRIYVDEPRLLWFDNTPVDGVAWVRAEKQPDGVLISSAHAYDTFHMHPAHARLLGKRLIRWANELDGGR